MNFFLFSHTQKKDTNKKYLNVLNKKFDKDIRNNNDNYSLLKNNKQSYNISTDKNNKGYNNKIKQLYIEGKKINEILKNKKNKEINENIKKSKLKDNINNSISSNNNVELTESKNIQMKYKFPILNKASSVNP